MNDTATSYLTQRFNQLKKGETLQLSTLEGPTQYLSKSDLPKAIVYVSAHGDSKNIRISANPYKGEKISRLTIFPFLCWYPDPDKDLHEEAIDLTKNILIHLIKSCGLDYHNCFVIDDGKNIQTHLAVDCPFDKVDLLQEMILYYQEIFPTHTSLRILNTKSKPDTSLVIPGTANIRDSYTSEVIQMAGPSADLAPLSLSPLEEYFSNVKKYHELQIIIRNQEIGKENFGLSKMQKVVESAPTKTNMKENVFSYDGNKLLQGNVAINVAMSFEEHKMRLIFIDGEFFVYKNGYYRPYAIEQVRNRISEYLKPNHQTLNNKRDILASLEEKCHVPSRMKDTSNGLVNFSNCVYDIKARTSHPHDPKYLCFTQVPTPLNRTSTCPQWLQFLDRTFDGLDDKEKIIETLQEFFGYCLQSLVCFEKMGIFYGDGATGKSCVAKVLNRLLGEHNVSSVTLKDFQSEFMASSIIGKMLNICAEGGNDSLQEGLLKAIISEDNLTFNRKYRDPITCRPHAKLLLTTNNLPYISDRTDGTYRKLLLFQFLNKIPKEHRIPNFDEVLYEQEGAGIASWAVKGLQRLIDRNGFDEPKSMNDDVDAYRIENNTAMAWVDACCELDLNYYTYTVHAISKYTEWAKRNGHHPMGSTSFYAEMRRMGVIKRREGGKNRQYYLDGIKINIDELGEDANCSKKHFTREQIQNAKKLGLSPEQLKEGKEMMEEEANKKD